jgi:hypothetical protein
MKVGNETFYTITYKSKMFGELREYIWAINKTKAKEKFKSKFPGHGIIKIEEAE